METLKVLIVDDSRVSCAIQEKILSKTNFGICETASNAAEAVEKYRSFRPDVVTMDMNLPDADGIECSRRIKEIDPDARLLMISAMKDANLMAQGRAVGIRSFLQKPVNPNELIDALMFLCQDLSDTIGELKGLYVDAFAKALDRSLFSLIGVHSEVSSRLADGNYLDVDGIAVIIGLAGQPMGRAIIHMDYDTMRTFARAILGMAEDEPITDEEASDAVEEAANIIVGRGASTVNDLHDSEMRISPPGTIVGSHIRIANFKLASFIIQAETRIGTIFMNIGFAEGE